MEDRITARTRALVIVLCVAAIFFAPHAQANPATIRVVTKIIRPKVVSLGFTPRGYVAINAGDRYIGYNDLNYYSEKEHCSSLNLAVGTVAKAGELKFAGLPHEFEYKPQRVTIEPGCDVFPIMAEQPRQSEAHEATMELYRYSQEIRPAIGSINSK